MKSVITDFGVIVQNILSPRGKVLHFFRNIGNKRQKAYRGVTREKKKTNAHKACFHIVWRKLVTVGVHQELVGPLRSGPKVQLAASHQ